MLPDLGGHLYSCVDKANGARDVLRATTAIKKARVAYRGAWTALGIEFNFPVSHNWVTASPVDYAIVAQPRRQRVGLGRQRGPRLRHAVAGGADPAPGSARAGAGRHPLQPAATSRHRFYWWNNAGVRVWDDSRIEYPMRFTASHGFRDDRHLAREPGRRRPHRGRATTRSAPSPSSATAAARRSWASTTRARRPASCTTRRRWTRPTKKIWSWGSDADGLDWRKALSDDESAYVEVQAGPLPQPGDLRLPGAAGGRSASREYWMPVRAHRRHHAREPGRRAAPRARRRGGSDRPRRRPQREPRRARRDRCACWTARAVVREEPFHAHARGRAAPRRSRACPRRRATRSRCGTTPAACCSPTPRTGSTWLPASEIKRRARSPRLASPPPDRAHRRRLRWRSAATRS